MPEILFLKASSTCHEKQIMGIFDAYIKKVFEYVEEMQEKGRQVREIDCSTVHNKLAEGLPVKVGPQAGSGVILKRDTFVELGNPEMGSCAFLMCTDKTSLIRDGRITLIGHDIQEAAFASLPFGQVLMAGGEDLGDEEHEMLEQYQYISDKIEGYMIRSVPQRMWCRVSKEAAEKGFSFETLGRSLMAIFKSEVPDAQTVELIFVTSSKEDVQQLDDIAAQIRKIGKDIASKNWKEKGFDLVECTYGWDCNSCSDKTVCDDIRKLVTVRKKIFAKRENGHSIIAKKQF